MSRSEPRVPPSRVVGNVEFNIREKKNILLQESEVPSENYLQPTIHDIINESLINLFY